MRIFSIKVRNRNLGSEMARYEANTDYQRDYYKRRKLAGGLQGTTTKLNIVDWRVGKI